MIAKKWGEDEVELLIAFREAGYTIKEIAHELNRSTYSIESKTKYLKIGRPYKIRNNAEYVKELKEKHPTIVALEDFININKPILHKCLICNCEYKVQPNSKLRGRGCKICSMTDGINPAMPGITYLVDFYELNIIKPGVTGKTTEIRNKYQGQKYTIIFERHFDSGRDAMDKEQEWLRNTKHLRLNTGLLKNGGNTETFRDPEYRK